MKTYQCHKRVEAAKILKIEEASDGNYHLFFSEQMFWITDRAFMEKHLPQAGGYIVEYEYGYRSYSPAKAFESGYTEVSE